MCHSQWKGQVITQPWSSPRPPVEGIVSPRACVHPLEWYLHQTLTVDLPPALVISKTRICTLIQVGHTVLNLPPALATSTTCDRTCTQVGRAAPIPTTTPETTKSLRDEPTPVRPTSRLVERTTAAAYYDTQSSHSTHASAYSRRSRSRSRTPRPSYRF
ncbi:hypothetical protein EDD16DRAFT_1240663 [Pisolithus croceorrhizus]|nr:hypothetical protein EDD16DRAFT_1240663 [Pisolithus croceorrhizus]